MIRYHTEIKKATTTNAIVHFLPIIAFVPLLFAGCTALPNGGETDGGIIEPARITILIPDECTISRKFNDNDKKLREKEFYAGMHSYKYDKYQEAVEHFGRSAELLHPPSLYMLGIIYQRDKRYTDALPFLLCSALLGFHKADADVGYYYANFKLKDFDEAKSYAWLTLAIRHDPKEFGDLYKEKIGEMKEQWTPQQARRAEAVKSELLDKMELVPKFSDYN